MIEGSPPGSRFVIVRRDSMEQLKGWRYSPEYMATHKIGEKYAKFTVWLLTVSSNKSCGWRDASG